MHIQRVRIDASLHPSSPIGLSPIAEYRDRFASGEFDHLGPPVFDRLSSVITRATLLDLGVFNQELNMLLRQYGVWVTNIPSDSPEYALGYDSDHRTSNALPQALELRDWFLPAASVLHRVSPAHIAEIDGVLGSDHLSACCTVH